MILLMVCWILLKPSFTEAVCGDNCLTSTADNTLICRDICLALPTNENVSCSDNCTTASTNETVACNNNCTTPSANETVTCNGNCTTPSANETVTCNDNCTTPSANETVTCNDNCTTPSVNETVTCNGNCTTSSANGTIACNDNCTTPSANETVACNDNCTTPSTNDTEVCIDNCLSKMLNEKCNETTDECLYGCIERFTGPFCNVPCIRNCVSCTLDTSTQKPNDTRCSRCQKGYYRKDNNCERCGTKCLRNASSTLPICKEADGRCEFGCQDKYYGITCNRPCSATCKDKLCGGYDGTCTKGCFSMEYTGPNCAFKCNSGCEGGLCHQNGTCPCKPYFWGEACASSCSNNCTDAPGNDTKCDPKDGKCKFGCLNNTLWGPLCSEICSENCNSSICDQYKGECTYGCFVQKRFDPHCTKKCNVNCTNGMCFQLDGTCIDGCETGWYGEKCTTECPENCVNRTCFSRNGTCTFGCVAGFTGSRCYEAIPLDAQESSTIWVYVVIGCGSAVLLGILVATVCCTRKRVRRRRRKSTRPLTVPFDSDGKPQEQGRGGRRSNKQSRLFVQNPLAILRQKHKDKTEYTVNAHESIKVEHILNRVIEKDPSTYTEEFKDLGSVLTKQYDASRQLENLTKNFYNGIYPYDENRVILKLEQDIKHTDMATDYINASYIQGYAANKTYIAAQGPSHVTAKEFWKMAFEQNTELIVMLTVIADDEYSQREKYWPEKNETKDMGSISVLCDECNVFADFIVRTFKLTHDDTSKQLSHIQFTCWPENGPLPEAADMIEFHQKYRSMLKSRINDGPIIVHCTAGVGRTGMFLSLDYLTDEGLDTGEVNVYECVSKMRTQRVHMVQTCEQYEYLHKTVAQTFGLQCLFTSKSEFPHHIENLKMLQAGSRSKLEHILQNCEESMQLDDVYIESMSGILERHTRDRPKSDIPELRYRTKLECNTYINAVSVDTYRTKGGMIVTQMPTPNTVEEFYKLVVQKECSTILMLNKLDTSDQTQCVYWPTPNSVVKHGDIQVTLTDIQEQNTVARQLKFEDCQSQEVHHATMIQYSEWDQADTLPDIRSLLNLVQVVKRSVEKSQIKRLLVHCLNGSEQTGLFCVLYNLVEKIDCEDEFGVMSTVRKIKTRRPSIIPGLDQLLYCHEAVLSYIKNYHEYDYARVTS